MKVPQHIGVMGDTQQHEKLYAKEKIVGSMNVPERLMVDGNNSVRGTSAPPREVIMDKLPDVVKRSSMQFELPEQLTLRISPFPDVIEPKTEDPNTAASNAIDDNPLKELKLMRRQLTRLSTRMYELEEEGEKRRTRETLHWLFSITGVVALLLLNCMRLYSLYSIALRKCSQAAGPSQGALKIGNVRVNVKSPKRAELVPIGFASKNASPDILRHLKWLLQKDILRQDVFLLGAPGLMRSHLVLQYLELINREYEYLSVTRDTTEADIKQRREILSGTAFYTDLCAVRAALEGRVLVIDGVERAERNVLPILNNLLENREMQLDDGRFLMKHDAFDKLLEKYSPEELKKMGVERVSEEFHVVALGLPVPRFPGHTLDPPLRSRFQCRNVPDVNFPTISALFKGIAASVDADRADSLISLAYGLNAQDQLSLPHFPIDNLLRAAGIWQRNPHFTSDEIFHMLYPVKTIMKENEQNVVADFTKKFDVANENARSHIEFEKVELAPAEADVAIAYGGKMVTFKAPRGHAEAFRETNYVTTSLQEKMVSELAVSHSVGDFGLLGPKGSGKTVVIEEFAKRFGYNTDTMVLHQDLNSRELLQRRRMLENGDTIWEDSQLVLAAKSGSLCVLDGIERVHASALAVLAPLVYFKHLDLPDGSRMVSKYEFEALMEKTKLSEEEIKARKIHPIHPSFRLALIGDSDPGEQPWLTGATMALVPWHTLHALPAEQQIALITQLVPNAHVGTVQRVVELVETLRESHDAGLRGVALSLSLRKLIHIIKRDALYGGELRSLIEGAALSRFLPSITKTAFTTALDKAGIRDTARSQTDYRKDIDSLKRTVQPGEETLIPSTLFYENPQHTEVLRNLARDFSLGSHLLLIGNQGVGKNKLADRFLQLIGRPRHYMQLHRDTTVESLTLQTTIEGGKLVHEDSALVKAVRNGHVLVVDEADKAPLHVIAILKSLLDSGTLVLGDGRRIQPAHFPEGDKTIPLHPEFKMIMLANRPGFPFLGNDLFGVLGDLFSVHSVDNPSRDSELQMLRLYGPEVPEDHLLKLVAAFSELRDMADSGILQYPYSTRELVNIVKHANAFPSDSLQSIVGNVFDFDKYNEEAVKSIEGVFQKHGIPLGVDNIKDRIFLSQRHNIPPMKTIGSWGVTDNVAPAVLETYKEDHKVQNRRLVKNLKSLRLEKEHMRAGQFSEQECMWQIPMLDVNLCSDALMMDDTLIVAAVNPLSLYIVDNLNADQNVFELDLVDYLKAGVKRDKFEPRIRLCRFGDSVLIHEETKNKLLVLDLSDKSISEMPMKPGLLQSLGNVFSGKDNYWRMIKGNKPLIFEKNGTQATILSLKDTIHFNLPHAVADIVHAADDRWLIHWTNGAPSSLLCMENGEVLIRPLSAALPEGLQIRYVAPIPKEENLMLAADGFYCLKSDGFPKTLAASSVFGSARSAKSEDEMMIDGRRPYFVKEAMGFLDNGRNCAVLEGGVFVNTRAKWETPEYALGREISPGAVGGFLEAVDPKMGFVQYVPVPIPKHHTFHQKWQHSISKTPFLVTPWTDSKLLTIDTNGGIRSYEISATTIGRSYAEWQKMLGDDDANMRMEFERSMEDFDLSKLDDPKMGKFDPDNAPHMGGNQWMGGTGGYNTAGLGGVGGPFRMDAGHDVHQMPEMAKQQVPEHILRKAREISKAEYAKKLKEIQMSEYDDDAYQKLWGRVQRESAHLRSIIEQLEAKKKERLWARHQTTGDLDDGKLIEGMTGEKNIYRRRVEKLPEPGTPQVNPKRLRLHFDVSGSMYRFNGYDSRLQKSLEAALMVMTALEGKEQKVKYDIYGHSGDGPAQVFVQDKFPKNNKERLDLLKQMLAHTQFCVSGDYTVEALDYSIRQLAKEEDVDERIVVLVSDANLDRYGIRPKDLVNVMGRDSSVNSFVILIGSLGEQAARLQKALPAGKAFVCKETSELPQIMQSIFASTLV
ncbi:unnamed protein product, partial [Mesorhabditis spiculigera]